MYSTIKRKEEEMSPVPDMTPVRQLLAKRVSEVKTATGLTMAEISRRLDRNPAYLQQFISRGIPTELDERDRNKLAELLQLNPDQLKGPGRTRKWKRVVDWRQQPGFIEPGVGYGQSLKPSNRFVPSHHNEETALRFAELIHALGESKGSDLTELLQALGEPKKSSSIDTWQSKQKGLLPVYSLVPEDNKPLRISVQPSSYLPKDVGSNLGDRAYGVLIADKSMAPELREGARAIVNPDLPCRPNTTCIFRAGDVNEGGEVLIRRLFAITDEHFQVFSYESFSNALDKFEQGLKSAKLEAGTKSSKQEASSKQEVVLPKLELTNLSRKSYPHCHVIVGTLSPPVT